MEERGFRKGSTVIEGVFMKIMLIQIARQKYEPSKNFPNSYRIFDIINFKNGYSEMSVSIQERETNGRLPCVFESEKTCLKPIKTYRRSTTRNDFQH